MTSRVIDKVKMKEMEEKFINMLPFVIRESTSCHSPDYIDSREWLQSMLNYNISEGKKNRGLAVIQSFQCLVGNKATEEDLNNALLLGWCIEMLQAFFLMVDDVMDNSITRRGKPCWYTLEEVGLSAVNDALYVESAIYLLIRNSMKKKHYYSDIVDLFHDVTLQTSLGQNLDSITSKETNFKKFTLERYKAIVKCKTSYYSFFLPVGCAMHLAGIKDEIAFEEAKTILLMMGEFFQIQDDYLDCFGEPEVMGKIGTDIEENKCSWLIVQALLRCNDKQRLLLKENYGREVSDKVEKVKKIYRDLGLPEIYRDHEKALHSEIIRLINEASPLFPKEMFFLYLEKIYKRAK